MKIKFLLTVLTAFTLTSCKKTYNCECKGFSVQSQLFADQKTVTATSQQKAKDSCLKKKFDYDNQYNPNDPNGLVLVNCELN